MRLKKWNESLSRNLHIGGGIQEQKLNQGTGQKEANGQCRFPYSKKKGQNPKGLSDVERRTKGGRLLGRLSRKGV